MTWPAPPIQEEGKNINNPALSCSDGRLNIALQQGMGRHGVSLLLNECRCVSWEVQESLSILLKLVGAKLFLGMGHLWEKQGLLYYYSKAGKKSKSCQIFKPVESNLWLRYIRQGN